MDVTSRDEAIKLSEQRDSELVQRLIAAIEDKIRNKYTADSKVVVYPDEIFHEASLEHNRKMTAINTAKQLYESRGWVFKYNDSQRDGSWIELV